MSVSEAAFTSLLQGVSQQQPEFRLPGQLEAQDNMLSDVVTGLRRRPGCKMVYQNVVGTLNANQYKGQFVNIGGQEVHVLIDSAIGSILILDKNYSALVSLSVGSYLVDADINNIHTAVVGDEMFVCNVNKKPTAQPQVSGIFPFSSGGFFTIKAGVFSTKYTINIYDPVYVGNYSFTYETPDGTTAGDAALSTPEYIAQHILADMISLGLSGVFTRDNNTVSYYASNSLARPKISSGTGDHLVITSGISYVTEISDLPPILGTYMARYVVATGSVQTPTYYEWDPYRSAWIECPAVGSEVSIATTPFSIQYNAGVWGVVGGIFATWKGRLAGDSTTSPHPAFIRTGITGMSSYQGRLVLLAGAYICMSDARNPRRFYRTTVTDIIDSDCIEVGAVANSAASYTHGIQYNKDLVVFSSGSQAVVPSSQVAITPRNANVVVTSDYPCFTNAKPAVLGGALAFAAPRSASNFGLMAMVPSQATDSQYSSHDMIAHLPTYTTPTCRFIDSSGVSGLGMVGFSDKRTLLIHEYLIQGDQQVQQAWHKWTFSADIAWAYFSRGILTLIFIANTAIVIATIDPRSLSDNGTTALPFLDFYSVGTVTANSIVVPAFLRTLIPSYGASTQLTESSGARRGELVGSVYDGSVSMTTGISYPAGSVYVGLQYLSNVTLTPPQLKDRQNVSISTNGATLLRYNISTADSAEFNATISDFQLAPEVYPSSTLYWDSADLILGGQRVAKDSMALLPCRLDVPTSVVSFSSNGVRDMNFKTIEYAIRTKQKIRRG